MTLSPFFQKAFRTIYSQKKKRPFGPYFVQTPNKDAPRPHSAPMVQCPRAKQEKPLRRGQTPYVEGIDWSAHASVSSRGCRLKSQHHGETRSAIPSRHCRLIPPPSPLPEASRLRHASRRRRGAPPSGSGRLPGRRTLLRRFPRPPAQPQQLQIEGLT